MFCHTEMPVLPGILARNDLTKCPAIQGFDWTNPVFAGSPILLITHMITDRIGFHSVLLPLLIIIIIVKVLDLGKLHHCKNSENRLHQLSCVISVIVENKPHAHLKKMNSKSSRFLSPVSKVSARNVWEHQVLVGAQTRRKIKKKGLHF